jgi:hypothetical protein
MFCKISFETEYYRNNEEDDSFKLGFILILLIEVYSSRNKCHRFASTRLEI